MLLLTLKEKKRPRAKQRRECGRRRRTLMVSMIFTIILLLLDDTFTISDHIFVSLFPPSELMRASASDLFYFQTMPSWTVISLDGHPLAHLPSTSTESPLQLTKVTHQISWQAEPFQPVRCLLTIPGEKGAQTCHVTLLTNPNRFTPFAQLVAPPQSFSLRLLSATSRQHLLAATQHVLDTLQSTDIVYPGEAYQLTPNGESSVQHATHPLHASLRFLLDTDTSRPTACEGISLRFADDPPCFVDRQDCRLFCSLQWPIDAQPHWDVGVIVRTLRTYTSIEMPQQKQTAETQQFLTLRIRWEQGLWYVSFHHQGESFSDDPNCHDLISVLVATPHYRSLVQSHWTFLSGFNRAQGCVAVMRPDDPSQAITAPLAAETLLFRRFGVLLAASARASQQWPELPKISTQEQELVKEIVHHPAFIS